MRSTYFEIGKGERATTVVLPDEFLCDLANTKEYQEAVDSYAQGVAGRIRCGSPDLFYCFSNRAIRIKIKWPIQSAIWQGAANAWLLTEVTDEADRSVARCCVDINRRFSNSSSTILDDVRISVNRIRQAIDQESVTFFASLQNHPDSYQHVDEGPARFLSAPPKAEVERFIAGKTYMLAFQMPDVPGEIFATDPWDAEYLGVSKRALSQAAYVLRARGLVELDMSQTFARPSDKLVTDGWPGALGADAKVVRQQLFELSALPKKEELTIDLNSSLKEGSEIALVFIDLDKFKEVNDTQGHARGDACLEAAVGAVGKVVGRKGRLYRWGGDEFAITLADFSTEEALVTAERVRRAIEESKPGGDITVTASIGVCGTDVLEDATAEMLLKAADDAMYASKRNGK
jgi:diguanylate cyclase (GGDEF)-like protein